MLAAQMVRERRKEAGYSAATFGQAIGVSARQVRRYESGEIDPPLSTAGLMARALGLPLDDLFIHEPEADKPSTADGTTHGDRTAGKQSPVPAHNGR